MECPSCSGKLTQMQASGVTLDVCQGGCGGIWFDRDELESFDEESEFNLDSIVQHQLPEKITKKQGARHCPNCEDQAMARMSFDIKDEVEIDQCFTCGGVWLDGGEISSIRAQFKTMGDRKKAGDAYLSQAEKSLEDSFAAARKEEQQDLEESEEHLDFLRKSMLWLMRRLERTHSKSAGR